MDHLPRSDEPLHRANQGMVLHGAGDDAVAGLPGKIFKHYRQGGGAALGQQFFDTSPFQFNLSTPGARSLGMGGAFLALADDATAAYTNPAGLTNLTVGGPEVAVELRHWQFSNVFLDGGHVCEEEPCPLTGHGVDSVEGVEFGEAKAIGALRCENEKPAWLAAVSRWSRVGFPSPGQTNC